MSPWFAMGLAPTLQPWTLIAAGVATVTDRVIIIGSLLLGFWFIGSSIYYVLES